MGDDTGSAGVALERAGVDIGGIDERAFARHRDRARATDALACGSNEGDFAFESSSHVRSLREMYAGASWDSMAILSSGREIGGNW